MRRVLDIDMAKPQLQSSSGGSAEIEYSEGHCTPGKKLF